jgi:hypothetical protein
MITSYKPKIAYPFTYWYRNNSGNIVEASSLSEVPEDIELYCNTYDIGKYFQRLGANNVNPHTYRREGHLFMLEILPLAIEKYGRVFPRLYRGVRSDRPDGEYKLLFGSEDIEVAKFYGKTIKEYLNVRGLEFHSVLRSVKSDDYSDGYGEMDREVIFLP